MAEKQSKTLLVQVKLDKWRKTEIEGGRGRLSGCSWRLSGSFLMKGELRLILVKNFELHLVRFLCSLEISVSANLDSGFHFSRSGLLISVENLEKRGMLMARKDFSALPMGERSIFIVGRNRRKTQMKAVKLDLQTMLPFLNENPVFTVFGEKKKCLIFGY